LLYSKGYVKEDIIGLIEFLDWSLQVSEEEEVIICEEVNKIDDSAKLKEYHRYAARCNSINEFKSLLNGNK